MKKTLRIFLAILTLTSTPLAAIEEASNCYQQPIIYCYEDNNYLYRWNVSISPFGWLFGYYCGASLAYALNNNIAVRGDLGATIFNVNDECDRRGVKFTVGVPIYFCSVYNGPFIEPQISTRVISNCHCSGSLGMMVGWHWMWDSGMNVSIAIGGGQTFTRNCCNDSGLRGYFQVGYNF